MKKHNPYNTNAKHYLNSARSNINDAREKLDYEQSYFVGDKIITGMNWAMNSWILAKGLDERHPVYKGMTGWHDIMFQFREHASDVLNDLRISVMGDASSLTGYSYDEYYDEDEPQPQSESELQACKRN